MSASLVGSEMCIRDSFSVSQFLSFSASQLLNFSASVARLLHPSVSQSRSLLCPVVSLSLSLSNVLCRNVGDSAWVLAGTWV
eukprot:13859820-Alexandrium_andersonii.AAC.1